MAPGWHRNRFFNDGRNDRLLEGINGYISKIEEGTRSDGLHLHIVVFFSGQSRKDVGIAKSLGEYWANVVTQGMGAYWNSNADKDKYEQIGHGDGTGQIDRKNDAKREALRQNLLYLAKGDQHVSTRLNPHYRTFGTSHLPVSGLSTVMM